MHVSIECYSLEDEGDRGLAARGIVKRPSVPRVSPQRTGEHARHLSEHEGPRRREQVSWPQFP